MKKRKIRYDRILLPILIIFIIIFGISSCHKTEETKFQTKAIHTTTDFLKNALKPVGQTLYIYGGGWNEAQTGSGTEALTLGLSKEWKTFYASQDSTYNYENYMYEIHKGLDCSGYVGWAIYNTLETKSNHGDGYVLKAEEMTKTFANMKLGTYYDSILDAKPGDIVSMANAHVYIVLGVCEDGSLLIVHSSPPGVKISGTHDQNGNSNSQAVKYAQKIMETYYPDWYSRYPDCTVDSSFTESSNVSLFHWNSKTLKDTDQLHSMSVDQIIETLFK